MRHSFEGAGFFKEMRRSGDDLHFLLAAQLRICFLVHLDHWIVETADYQQGRRSDLPQGVARQIGSSAARYYGPDLLTKFRGGDQSGAAACAGSKVSDLRIRSTFLLVDPAGRIHQSFGEQSNVKT